MGSVAEATGDVVGGPANPLEGEGMWSAGRGASLHRGGVARGAVGGAAPRPEWVRAPAGGGGGGGGGIAAEAGVGPAGQLVAVSVGGNGSESAKGEETGSVLSAADGRTSAGPTDEVGGSSSGDVSIG